MEWAIDIQGLEKKYGNQAALRGISFEVSQGSCFGLLGPNGAGKSTTMKILSGLVEPDSGVVSVFGMDIRRSADQIKERLGYVPQSITLYEKLSAAENLAFFGEMYGIRGAELRRRMGEVLEQVGLSDRAKDAVGTFSGGMKRRINFAAAMLHQPQLIILDEPTVGIDPQSRNHIFELIRHLKDAGVTIVYSTHYMEEVETICDDLAIIDRGQVIVQGALDRVIDQFGSQAVYLEADAALRLEDLADLGDAAPRGRGWLFDSHSALDTLARIASECKRRAWSVKQLEIVRPSLETVFLSLTGTTLRDE